MLGLLMKMLRHSYVLVVCLIISSQQGLAEENNDIENVDEEFLEVLGSFEAENGEWYDLFWSTIEEAMQEDTADMGNE